jgi:hypothetical protein
MKLIVLSTVLATLSAGTLAFSAVSAKAYTVCNRAGECWHTDSRYKYREPGITVHPDDWYFHRDWDHDKAYRWRHEEHRDRGYYRDGVWIHF